MRAPVLVTSCLCLLLIACGGSPAGDSADTHSRPDTTAAADIEPCSVLNDNFVRSHFEVGNGEISVRPASFTLQSVCLVTWSRPNEAEVQSDFKKRMSEYGMAVARGEKPEMPSAPRSPEVSLTIARQTFENAAQAASELDTAVDILRKGVASAQATTIGMRGHEIEPIEGLANKAAWIVGMNQISVATDHRVFHLVVNVHDDPDANRAKAVDVARQLLEEIR